MIRATKVFSSSEWSHVATDRVVLDHDGRHRRRVALKGEGGTEFLLDLPEARALREGDGLLLDDGRVVEVKAAPETLSEVRGTDPDHLLRLAWHLGNRHLPTQILGNRLLIRHDHVIDDMLRGLGATVTAIEAPFDPEGGAYGGHVQTHGHGHGHGHHHEDGHHHHGHDHKHPHDHGHG